MTRIIRLLLAILSFSAGSAAAGGNFALRAFYPEGPIFSGGDLYFAEMHKDRIVSVKTDKHQVFYHDAGCGPTAIAPYKAGFIVLCHLKDELHTISDTGALLKTMKRDTAGDGFTNPNDASADDADGVYFTASGIFSLSAPHEGALLYLDEKGDIHRLASGLFYANGVYFDAARRTVFVSEHFARRILAYPVKAPGELGDPSIFAELPVAALHKTVRYDRAGPDGLEADADGNLYVAYYGAGLVLVLSPAGEIIDRIDVPEKLTTNIALSPDGSSLFVTGSRISAHKPYPGKVRKMISPLDKKGAQR